MPGRDMPILVTGAGGFVGRKLVTELLLQGREVVALDVSDAGIPDGARIVTGDFGDESIRRDALANGCAALVHLATVPGGAAEADPAASKRINVDAMYDLLTDVAAAGSRPRVVYASSIAVLGDPLPALVDDATPVSPKMIYGGHKAMMEHALAMFSNRNMIDGIALRLPGILARPKAPSGMKSAFMSNIFHDLKADQEFVCPVSADATIWAQSVTCCVRNFLHGLHMDTARLPANRSVTLPALRIKMDDLAVEIARQCGVSADLVAYEPDADLEGAFGCYPPLRTQAADAAGFLHDGTLEAMVGSALKTL